MRSSHYSLWLSPLFFWYNPIMKDINKQDIEAISRILGEELTGSAITTMFNELGLHDYDVERGFTNTKWRRIDESVFELCSKVKSSWPLFNVIEYVAVPSRYIQNPIAWESLKTSINQVLIFKGFELADNGKVRKVKPATTFSDAQNRLKTLNEEIKSLNLHSEVTKFCTLELIQKDYFHAVFEATKGLFNRIRSMSELTYDGGALIDKAFNPKLPLIMIQGNMLSTQDEKNQYYGLVNSIKTCLYLYRNHQAHVPRLFDELSLNDSLRALMVLSLAHELLDKCVNIRDFKK